jgi:hypothetical protein
MDLTQIFGAERCSRNGSSRYTVRANGRRCPLGCCCRCHVTLLRHSHRCVSLGSTWNLRRLVELTAPLRHNPSSLLTMRGIRAIPIGAETTEILTVLRPDVVDARRLIFAKNDQTPLDRWNLLRKHPEACREEVRPFRCHLASSEAQPRDDARCRRHSNTNDAGTVGALCTGDHARSLFACDSEGAEFIENKEVSGRGAEI